MLLREGYREGGKVKHRTLANLSHCSDEEIEAIRIALKMKKNLVELKNLAKGSYCCGKHVGPVAVLYQIANHLGITVKEGISRLAKITSNVIAVGEKRFVTVLGLNRRHTAHFAPPKFGKAELHMSAELLIIC